MAKISLTIPQPIPMPHRRGVQGFEHCGKITSFRMTVDDFILLEEEAAHYGISVSALIRWITLHAVQQMHKQRTGEKVEITP